jgi:hypothetical protein
MAKIDYHEGLPIERLKELESQGITEYRCKIARRSDGGMIASLKTVVITLAEMANLEDMLNSYAGGGPYLIQAFHPEEGLNRLFAFRMNIVGQPKIPLDRAPAGVRSVPSAPSASDEPRSLHTQLFSLPTPPNAPGTPFGAPLMSSGRYAQPVAAHTADEIALNQVEDERRSRKHLEQRFEALQDELVAERAAHNLRIEDERKERDRLAQDAERQRHAGEIKRLEDLIANSAKPKGPNIAELVASAVPFLPVVVALIDARKHSASVESERLTKMNEIQMAGANKLMEATLAQRGSDSGMSKLLETLVPLAVPLITTMLTSSGPKAQAELMATQADVQMQQYAMVAQMLEQMTAQAPTSEWLPLIENMMTTIGNGIQAYAKSQARPSLGQAVATTLTQHLNGSPAQVDPKLPRTAPVAPVEGRTLGETVADALFAHPACPEELKTQEWFTIVAMLHDQTPVDAVAETISNHMLNLDGAKTTPTLLEPFWTEPEKTLAKLFSFLPIWQSQILYAKQVIAKVIATLSAPVEEGGEGDDEGDDEGNDEGEGEEAVAASVTPMPTAAAV